MSVAVDDGWIVATGEEAVTWRASFDRVVELDGRLLLPAFRDGHAHPLHAGINRLTLDFTGITTLDGTLEALRQWRLAHPEERWIVDPSDFRSRSRNTPIAGWELVGRVRRTLVSGEIRFERT